MPASSAAPVTRIAEEIEAVQVLLQLVESEQQTLLQAAGIDELQGITVKKTEVVGRIGDLTRFRYTTLSHQGYRADEAGMRDWMADVSDPAIRERWEFLLSVARKIKVLNQMNGQLIAKLMSQNQTILDVLGITARGAGLYGSDGRPQGFGYLK